jgi:hypothetical protein
LSINVISVSARFPSRLELAGAGGLRSGFGDSPGVAKSNRAVNLAPFAQRLNLPVRDVPLPGGRGRRDVSIQAAHSFTPSIILSRMIIKRHTYYKTPYLLYSPLRIVSSSVCAELDRNFRILICGNAILVQSAEVLMSNLRIHP